MYEYLDNDESTWRYQKLPDIPNDFVAALTRIGGLNRFGQPNLRVVKGNEIKNDRFEDKKLLKYHAGWTPMEVSGYIYEEDGEKRFTTRLEDLPSDVMVFPSMQQEELGLLRYVIEKWTAPEELERVGRFKRRKDFEDKDNLLREFPREGVYDTYFIVQNANKGFKTLGSEVLKYIEFRWHWEHKTFAEQEAERERILGDMAIARKKLYEEKLEAAISGDIRLPKEEIERREWYWHAVHDYTNDAQRIAESRTFYMN